MIINNLLLFLTLLSSSNFGGYALPEKSTNQIRSINRIPVLCYHNIKSSRKNEWQYFITPKDFENQIKELSKNGYVSILPDDIYEHYTRGKALPAKPVMISFDDNWKEQFTVAAPVLKKYGYKATFFIMMVSVNKKNFMSSKDIKQLHTEGHCIALHSWDHPDFRKLPDSLWKKQVTNPRARLEKWIGEQIMHFGYPYGACNKKSAAKIKAEGFKAAFQLAGKTDYEYPLHTIRRLMVHGNWSGERLMKEMKTMTSENSQHNKILK